MDDKSKDLGNMNSENGCIGSRRRMLKVTQTKELITPEGGTDRSFVVSESFQDSDIGETNDTDPGKEAITPTSESVLILPQRLEDAGEYSTGFTKELSKK
ncbi:unnamed protein product [Lepeophtheirus salmonis]|uniref:(salmon louse) hypothetical protein n=1 Tax=Lepeophtheirus salmonis TaxID=72036 RepID=A0A7R8CER6_LEPSM|nr:unnamed protein product [Lepeophtheirus salmonis]CAF2798521.1 unnamed protein product [Lepeophtheirus salmonis]